MAVRTIRSRPGGGIVYIPTTAVTYTKINIIDDSGTTYTVLDSYGGADDDNWTTYAILNCAATDKLSNFRIHLLNTGGRYMNKFDGGELVHFYADATDATTHIFTGKIDNVKYGLNKEAGWTISIIGRGYAQFSDKIVNKTYAAADCAEALASLFSTDFDDVKLQFWNDSAWATATYDSGAGTVSWDLGVTNLPSSKINVVYSNATGISVMTDICNRTGLDGYSYYDISTSQWYYRTSVVNAITNTGSNIAYGVNLLGLADYGIDNNKTYNRIKVYGKTESTNILLLKTEEDATSQSNLWIKDKIVTASDLETMGEVQEKADAELTVNTTNNPDGAVTSVLLHTLRQGEKINVSIPYTGIGGTYRIKEFTHDFAKNTTTVNFNNTKQIISDYLMTNINNNSLLSSLDNPYSMKDSYTVYFDESPSVMNHVGTSEVNKKLVLSVSSTSGIATSNNHIADYDITSCEFRRYHNDYIYGDVYEVSNLGGASGTWNDITTNVLNGTEFTFSTTGRDLKFKITLKRAATTNISPSYESVCLLYK